MTRPTIQVRVAFVNNPFVADSTLTWTDISSDVVLDPAIGGEAITIRRGRQAELGRIEAGTLSLTLANRSRQYDPENASGAYYPNIKPMKRIQVRATWSSTTYALFTGYIQAWEPIYPAAQQALVRVRAVDAMNAIARATVTYTGNEFINWAILSVLTLIGWPSTDWVYDGAQSQVPTGSYVDQNPLQLIQSLIEAENGLFFIQGNGNARFQDRHWRIRNATSAGTFGNNSGELPYETVDLSFDEQLIYNDIQVTRAGGALQEAVDSASQAAYGPRVLTKSGILLGSDTEALSLAQWLLLRYRDPALRVPRIVLNGDLAPSTLWPHVLGRELSDKITVNVRPPGGGTISKAARIESMSHSIGLDAWRATWDISMDSSDQYWQLDSATLSVLGTTTKLAY